MTDDQQTGAGRARDGGLADFRAQLDLLDLVGRLTDVARVSGGKGKISCPFRAEKSPSCQLYPADNSFYCFGCQTGGDIFKLVMALRDCTFGEALEWLSDQSGVARPARSPEQQARDTSMRRLRAALIAGRAGRELPFGLEDELASKVGLGFAQDLPEALEGLPRQLLTPAEARAWQGCWTLELHARSGIVGFGAFAGQRLSGDAFEPAAAAHRPYVVGLPAAREVIAHSGVLFVAPDAALMLELQAAGVRGVIGLIDRLDAQSAALIAGLAGRIALVSPAGADPAEQLPGALRLVAAGARAELAAAGPRLIPVPLYAYLLRRARVAGASEQRALMAPFLDAQPSPSTRALYLADMTAHGVTAG